MQVEQANSHNAQLVQWYSGNSNQFVGHRIFTGVVLKWYNLLTRLCHLVTMHFPLSIQLSLLHVDGLFKCQFECNCTTYSNLFVELPIVLKIS